MLLLKALAVVVVALCGVHPHAVHAQSTVSSGASGELDLSAEWFGVGNVARPGGWTAIRVRLRDNTDRPREVMLALELRDGDGDRPVYRRVFTANPGRWQQHWLYAHLPHRLDPARPLRLTAREVVREGQESVVGSDGALRVSARSGRLLAEARATPGQLLSDHEGMMAIVGDATHGLSLYSSVYSGTSFSPLAHERTEMVSRLAPLDLPDRWMGLAPFEIIVWSGSDPADLGDERSRALREWIERGGHLVIVLTVENLAPWTTGTNNLLRDLFPAAEVVVREGADLNQYRHLITRDPDMGLPRSALVHTFEPLASAGPQESIPILAGPEGECVVVRRLVGQGMVTAVGMGAGSRALSNVGLPAPDVFWNRVLGRRGQFEPLTRLNDLNTSGARLTNRADPVLLDRDIDGSINLIGQSLAGVVLAFALFGIYWLTAGPGGFAVLRRMGLDRHAWVAFVGAAALFTAIAWGGATAIKPKRVEVRHVTVLDHVYGQDVDRARSWLSVLIPSYLGADVSVQGEGLLAGLPRFYQTIAPWQARPDSMIGTGDSSSFPDARSYDIDAPSPDVLSVPTRATVKQFVADWAGAPRFAWPTPSMNPGSATAALALDPTTGFPTGVLTHNFPETLTNVQVILIRRQQGVRAWSRGTWVGSDGRANHLGPVFTWTTDAHGVAPPDGRWPPGTPLDLHPLFMSAPASSRNLLGWLDRAASGRESLLDRMVVGSFMHQLSPPQLSTQASPLFTRSAMHGLDLSGWFSQPCLIILGTLDMEGRDAMPIPVNIRVGGEARTPHVRGRTLVRWIYPLPADPPSWPTGEPDSAASPRSPAPM